MPIIEVNHVTKEYQLGHITSLKENVANVYRRMAGKSIHKRENFKALDDVSFSIEQGEVVGIIGHNGAGKSTLLKHLANISKPTKGSVIVRGSVAPLIEVGAGVNPELTGRENIYLNGAILGIPKKIIQQKLDEIIQFSELEQFIDTPVKRYSSGMTVKLGFSIATSLDADILIVDEVLAVGDLAFQRKCFDRMEDMIKRQGKTVLLVSHNIRQVERLCTRVILLNNGKMLMDGKTESVTDAFFSLSDEKIKKQSSDKAFLIKNIESLEEEIEVLNISLINKEGQSIEIVPYKSDFSIAILVRVKQEMSKLTFGIGVHTPDLLYLTTIHSEGNLVIDKLYPGEYVVECKIDKFPFLPGTYALLMGVSEGDLARNIFYGENIAHFQIVASEKNRIPITVRGGFIGLGAKWGIKNEVNK